MDSFIIRCIGFNFFTAVWIIYNLFLIYGSQFFVQEYKGRDKKWIGQHRWDTAAVAVVL